MQDKTELIKPGYFNKMPLMPVISAIRYTIGLQDSCIQTNQASILFFEQQANLSENKENFIKETCRKFKISLGISDMDFFKSIQYKSYILQTYNLVEPFFKELNRAYRNYNNFRDDWKTKIGDKSLDPFNQLLENIGASKKVILKACPEFFLLEYYRLVRNSIVHLQESEDEHKKTLKYFNGHIKELLPYFKENYELTAPNEPDSVSFYDFMLYTRALKYYSNVLNDVCFPDTDTFVVVAKTDEILQKKLLPSRNLNYKGALLKRINVLRKYFHGHFNTSHKEIRDDFCRAYLKTEGHDYSEYL
jgi:hypothetical protein